MLQRQLQNSFLFRKLFCLILLLLIAFIITAQTPYLKHFTIEDGLPSSTIHTAFQDSSGIMWFGTENGITRFNGYRFETFNMSSVKASTDIWGVFSDTSGRLWFSSQRQLTYLENDVFKAIPFPKDKNYSTVSRQYLDKKGNHYIRFQNAKILYQVDLEHKKLVPFEDISIDNIGHQLIFLKENTAGLKWFLIVSPGNFSLIGYQKNKITKKIDLSIADNSLSQFNSLIPIDESTYIFPSNDKFIKVNIDTEDLSTIENPLINQFKIINNHQTINNLTLLNTDKGYKVINKNFELIGNLDFLNQELVNNLFEDKKGNIWICTRAKGIYFLPKNGRKSQTINTVESLKSDITTLTVDKKNRVWFTNKDLELKILKPNGMIHTIKFDIINPTKPNTYLDDLKFDAAGNLYIGSSEDLFIVVPKEKIETLFEKTKITVRQKTPKYTKRYKKNYRSCYTEIYEKEISYFKIAPVKALTTYNNTAYLVTSNVTYAIIFKEEGFIIKQLTNGRAYGVTHWKDKLWIGRKEQLFTLDILNKNEDQVKRVDLFPYPINALEVCRDNKLFIATNGNGLYRYDGEQVDTIREFLDTRIRIKTIHIDEENRLWIATNKGVGIVEITNDKPFKYNFWMVRKSSGLISNEVNTIHKVKSKIYVATAKGLTILNEKDIKISTEKFPLFFTNLLVNNEKYDLNKPLIFAHRDNNFRIDYLCLSYSNMGNVGYEYCMKGLDKRWYKTMATFKEFTTLEPGNYTFKIRARNMNGLITDEKTLKFRIKLPWWRTWTAFILFVLASVGLSYWIFQYRLKQEKERNEKERLKELSQLKSRFYANITHEFRTPLTLIIGLTKQLKTGKLKSKTDIYEVVERHSLRLLNLINQLLDLNKLEAKAMPIHYQNGDIVAFAKYVVGLFQPATKAKNIHLILYTEVNELNINFDSDKIQSILFNLLSNAIKFTESDGEVIVHLRKNPNNSEFILKVQDNGVGISTDALAYVFNRFYQDGSRNQKSNNTGIGLALVKELVEQMNGKIDVKSDDNGTIFTIHLPIITDTVLPQNPNDLEDMETMVEAHFPTKTVLLSNETVAKSDDKPLLLLVEDDIDLMQYLQSIIGDYYEIEMAKDGVEGIEKAIEKVPDLIISDVMMPNKDGFELCETLKNDERTSHIPIILLTAKATKEAELKGLKSGADVYMVKPFYQEELIIRVNQLLENRRKLQARYQSADLPQIPITPEVKKEDAFILKVRAVIEANIDNYDLDINFLCTKLFVSRAQLHRKVKFLTGGSTTKFIKKVRLEKASNLLKETDLNITEIAYKTGFAVKYFSKVFGEEHGCSPSEYRKNLKM